MPSIVRTLTLQRREGGGEAHLRLQPDHLGELSVTLRVDGARVTAILRADSPVVRAWVQAHQQELRSALEDQGLTLDRLVVDPDSDGRHDRQGNPAHDRRPQNRRRSPASQFEALM
jgi:flagellar hook-length control protein FliK